MRPRLLVFLLLILAAAPVQAQVAADLYTLELVPAPELLRFTGFAELKPAPSPFTAPVTREGVHRYQVVLHIDSLPDPATLGNFASYVVWAAPPNLRIFVKLGSIDRNHTQAVNLGEVAFNRFILFVSAEADDRVPAPAGPFVMRGFSPSMRLGATHVVQARAPAAVHADHEQADWPMPPAHPQASAMYMPALHGLRPNTEPWLPDSGAVPWVKPRSLLRLHDGDSIRLEAGRVKRMVRGRTITMYGFNGEQPGPLLEVPAGARIHVNVVNRTAHETAVHWHGIRLDNRFDGVPHVTQHPIAPGDSFGYQIYFRDAGLYWYHPHHREDIQQDLGLYGNMLVREQHRNAYGPVHREVTLLLDDLLLGERGLIPYGAERATHALMGRFGNVLLINGEPAHDYRLQVKHGEVVRLLLTNVANTRTFNLSIPGLQLKVVGSDIGRYEQEVWSESIVLAPAERYIVEVRFQHAGTVPLLNHVQAIDHTRGTFFPETDTLGLITVGAAPAVPDLRSSHQRLRIHADVSADVAAYHAHFDRTADYTLALTMKDRALPYPIVQLLQRDTLFFNPVEWSGTMPMMDWLPTSDQVTWTLRDEATGKENEEITWKFKVGDVVKLRLVNDRHTLHAMAHPIHIHGQRFLVLSVNGRPTTNHVWKDTVLVPVGGFVDILLDVSNPGLWMIHCHIAEHLAAGMKTVFGVTH